MHRYFRLFVLTGIVCSITTSIACRQTFAAEDKSSGKLAVAKGAGQSDDDDKDAPKGKSSFSGNVSWYGPGFYGKKTASGEIFTKDQTTAAHKKLPFRTKVLVEDPKTGKSCVVKVNDRGPFVKTRVLDLSREAARRVGNLGSGVVYADCLVLDDK